MTAATFNSTRSRVGAWLDADPDRFGILLLQASEAAAAMRDHDTLAELLGAEGNTEATFTNYARKAGLTASGTIDDAADTETVYLPDQIFASAGGTVDNTLTTAVVFYEQAANDASRRPVAAIDLPFTTDGSDLILKLSENGVYLSEDTTP